MTVFTEGNLRISFPSGTNARIFDDASHGLSHCMKAVDFVVDIGHQYLFIEFKDPDAPGVPENRREEYLKDFLAGRIDKDLKYKCRDTFLYEWASGRADKPINYYVIIAIDTLTPADLLVRTDALKKNIPLRGPRNAGWTRPFVSGCAVFNIAAWNKHQRRYPVSRIQ